MWACAAKEPAANEGRILARMQTLHWNTSNVSVGKLKEKQPLVVGVSIAGSANVTVVTVDLKASQFPPRLARGR